MEAKYRRCSAMLILFFLLGVQLFGQESEGFVSLFNGENLEEWTPSEDLPESFSVEDGSLVVKGGKAHLYYTGGVGRSDFKNFELKLKVRTMNQANSGVYFHTRYQADGWPKIGFEAQVNSKHSDPRKTGSLYGIVNMWVPKADEDPFVSRMNEKQEVFVAQPKAPSSDGEWFDYHISVVDQTITIKVNGVVTVEWTQPELWLKNRRIGHGTIALQAHDPTCLVYYRDIMIKVLED